MSKEAQVVSVETVEIPLSERGLTDLAAMLVKSGRMSAASFREWAHRTQQFAGRWSNEAKPASSKKGKKTGSTTSEKTSQKSKKQVAKQQKDKEKLKVLKAVLPECSLGNWGEVMNLSEGKAESLQKELLEVFEKFSDHDEGVKGALLEFGLSETEIKLSRSFLPYLPRYQKLESRAKLIGASVAGEEEEKEEIPPKPKSSLKTAVEEAKGNSLRVEDFVSPPSAADKTTLSEHFGRYDWTSVPSSVPRDLVKNLKPAATVVGSSTSKWKKLSLVEKFSTLARHYNQGN